MNGRFSFLVGFAAWLSALWGCALVSPEDARIYATIWTGAVAVVASLFVIGYAVVSRPSRDEHGKRRWVGEWFWLPSLPFVIMIVYVNQFIFRLIVPAPANPTAEYLLGQRFAAGVAASVFFALLWLTVLWLRRQIKTRRANDLSRA